MAKYVELKELDPGPGMEYIYTMYPGDGLYYNPRVSSYYLAMNSVITYIGVGKIPTVEMQETSIDPYKLLAIALYEKAGMEVVNAV